jgi:hypothetical protein
MFIAADSLLRHLMCQLLAVRLNNKKLSSMTHGYRFYLVQLSVPNRVALAWMIRRLANSGGEGCPGGKECFFRVKNNLFGSLVS